MTRKPRQPAHAPATPAGGPTPQSLAGRPHVGVCCGWEAACIHAEVCREIYTQDLLNPDGSCPEFKKKG